MNYSCPRHKISFGGDRKAFMSHIEKYDFRLMANDIKRRMEMKKQ